MRKINSFHSSVWLVFLFFSCFSYQAFAQNAPKAICNDTDCSPALFSISTSEPRLAANGAFSAERTQSFQQTYLQFQQVKSTYVQKSGWASKYAASQLGGKSCLRHYQIESYLANEYAQNEDFKRFVDQQPDGNKDFINKGFQSSRKALNLKRRMEINCPEEAEEAEKKDQQAMDALPENYMTLGQKLGYFDKDGNIIKPIEIPKEELQAAQQPATTQQPQKKLSKRKQVKQLKERVANLPIGQPVQDKVNNVEQDLKKAKPRANKLGKFLKGLIPIAAAFLAPQLPLVANLDKIGKFLGGLLSWKPKWPRLGLFDKIKSLFGKGKKLKDKTDELLGKSQNWKDKVDELGKKAQDIVDGIDEKIKNVTDIKDELNDLQKKKDELTQKLEDRPKKILEELNQAVDDIEQKANELVNKAEEENQAKDKLLKELNELEQQKEALMAEKEQLEQEVENLKKETDAFQPEVNELEKEVEEIKAEEASITEKEQKLDELPDEAALQEALKICEDDLKSLLLQIEPVAETRDQLKEKFEDLADKPRGLLDKIKNLKLFQEKLKIPDVDIPIADRTIQKVDGLLEKAGILGSMAEILTGKKTMLQEKIEQMDEKFTDIKDTYENRTEKLEQLKGDLINLIGEKTGLKEKFANAMGNVEDLETAYEDFIKRYNIFEEDSRCIDQKELEEKMEDLKQEQEETEPQLEKLEEEVENLEEKEEQLQQETQEVEEEITAQKEQVEEIKAEEEKIKEEFGEDVKLEPVKAEEWTESFQVEREYWDAVFHPDDEVVEGFKGRWFQVQLKDADKNVKLLFGPGEYYMNKADFRDNYGSVIGAFVTEALNGMKKADRESIKLFVQGSADITGQNTFRGNLDDQYKYEEVLVLPQKGDSENFGNEPTTLQVPSNGFTNDDLPNLRGRYLKEMISVYSRKLDPILLQGAVKQKEGKEDRNAVIYLFIPDALVEKYGG